MKQHVKDDSMHAGLYVVFAHPFEKTEKKIAKGERCRQCYASKIKSISISIHFFSLGIVGGLLISPPGNTLLCNHCKTY